MSLPPSLTESSTRRTWIIRLLQVVLACVFGFFLSRLNLDYIEAWFYDVRMKTRPAPQTITPIELVLVRGETLQTYKRVPTFKQYSELVQKLQEEKPRFILLTMNLKDIEGTYEEKKAFDDLCILYKNILVLSDDLEIKGEEGKHKLPPPLSHVKLVPAPKTKDKLIFAKDGVTRRMLISAYDQILYHPLIASTYNKSIENTQKIKGQITFLESQQIYINYRPAESFPSLNLEEVLDGKFKPGRYREKLVLIGGDYRNESDNYVSTPYQRDNILAMNVAELHANMFQTLIDNSAPIKVPEWFNLILTILISILTIHVVLTAKPTTGLLVMGVTLLSYIILAWLAFWPLGYWVSMAHPIVAIFLFYYFFIPYRLIIENRRSWEYYQKNKLLHQVEELKTNFISMMSHDLKTPLARIQGMTDVILKDTTSISSQQREAVDTIKQSSDDLLRFINMILNYGKIESQGVELNLQTKDINNLLQDVIKKHEFLAKLKKIQIVAELEPIFPISVDPDLMKQVFSNLIENAIKYSPEDTKILVSSEESNESVIIQVADQGAGIPSDELSNIFMKFFRSKNAKTSPIKGSGLGLYLAKYFTELHDGKIFVESTYGQGSTFTVELPMIQRGKNA